MTTKLHFGKVPVPSDDKSFMTTNLSECQFRLEDVKKKIDLAEISSEPKCMPKAHRSPIGHPGAKFFKAEIGPRF